MSTPATEATPRVSIHRVSLHYHNHACYAVAMERVEKNRDRMLEELSEWSGLSVAEVVKFIGGMAFGSGSGRTFDEQLDATHGYAHIEILHSTADAA
jgi:hypothetical protein